MNGGDLIVTVPEDVSGSEIGWDASDVKPPVPSWFYETAFSAHPSIIIILFGMLLVPP